jgi:hypothetical protein
MSYEEWVERWKESLLNNYLSEIYGEEDEDEDETNETEDEYEISERDLWLYACNKED